MLRCPLCGKDSTFTPVFGPYEGEAWRCNSCGGICTKEELALANTEPVTEAIQ
jgi:hypothetical protein